MAFGSPASQRQGSDSLRGGSDISNTDEQDKFFGYQPVIGNPYYAPSIGYPYVMNPLMNPVCTMRAGFMTSTLPILPHPVIPNPNVPVPVPGYPSVPVPAPGYPPNPGYGHAPVPAPGYTRVRSGNGGVHHGGSYPTGDQGRPYHRPKSDSNNLGANNFGDKVRV